MMGTSPSSATRWTGDSKLGAPGREHVSWTQGWSWVRHQETRLGMPKGVCALRSEAGLGSRSWLAHQESSVTRGDRARIRGSDLTGNRSGRGGQGGKDGEGSAMLHGGRSFLEHASLLLLWPRCLACGILVPRPGIEPAPPAVEAWSLNLRTTREVPSLLWP